MLKLIVRRICFFVALFAIWFLVAYGYSFAALLLKSALKTNFDPASPTPLSIVIIVMLSFVISAAVTLYIKKNNKDVMENYLLHIADTAPTFQNNIRFVLKSKEYLASILVCNGVLIPAEVSGLPEVFTSVIPLIASLLILIVVQSLIFTAIDCSLWLLAFRKWRTCEQPQ